MTLRARLFLVVFSSLLPACGVGLCIRDSICSSSVVNRLVFTGTSHPSSSLFERFFNETDSWVLTGECDPTLGSVTIGGDLTAPKEAVCEPAAGGTFSVPVAYSEFETIKHTYGRKSVTIAQTGIEALSTYLYQSNSGFTVSEVSEPAQLQAMVTGNPNHLYVLTDDIDLAQVSATNNWTPLINFQGVIEGNGHQIQNLHISSGAVEVGFLTSAYDATSVTGSIQNLEFTNVDVTATAGIAGALVGLFAPGALNPHLQISNVHIQGEVSATAQAGGFIGWDLSTVSLLTLHDISFTGNVSGGSAAGGIFGELTGCNASATDVHFSGTVNGGSGVGGITGNGATALKRGSVQGTVQGTTQVGGAVGYHEAFSEIAEINVNATVMGTGPYVGGIAGWLRSPVRNCRSSGSVSGTSNVGGIGGRLAFSSSRIETSYTTMAVTGTTTDIGPLIGVVVGGSQSNNYFASASSCVGCTNALGSGLNATQLLQQASFTGFAFPSVWTLQEGVSAPKLAWE